MFCLECGTQLSDDAVFCHNCGAKFAAETPAESREEPDMGPRAAAESPARTRPTPTPRSTQPPSPVVVQRKLGSKYMGASMVATTLLVIGWLIAFLGIVGGFASASECRDIVGEECSAAGRMGVFLATVIIAWLAAVLVLWFAYVLQLLSDVETRLRSDQTAERVRRSRM